MSVTKFVLAVFLVGAIGVGLIELVFWRRRRSERRQRAPDLIAALEAYRVWLDAEELKARDSNGVPAEPSALFEARELKLKHFPEMTADMMELMVGHAELTSYLWRQESLRHSGRQANLDDLTRMRIKIEVALEKLLSQCRGLQTGGPGAPGATSGGARKRAEVNAERPSVKRSLVLQPA